MNSFQFSMRGWLLVLLAAVFILAGCGSVALQVKANSALQDKRYGDALAAYQEILKTDPANVEALKGIGETYLRMRKGPEAVAALEKAYKADPDQRTPSTSAWPTPRPVIMERPSPPGTYSCRGTPTAISPTWYESSEPCRFTRTPPDRPRMRLPRSRP